MNILFVTNQFPPLVDGVGDYTYNLAKEFVTHGHKAIVVCSNSPTIASGYYEGITVYPIIIRWDKNAGLFIAQIAKQQEVDFVCLQYVPHGFHKWGLPIGLWLGISIVRKKGFPVFTFFHEVTLGYDKWSKIKHNLWNFVMTAISKRIAKESSVVATSIEHYRMRLTNMGVHNIAVIPIPSNIPLNAFSYECNSLVREDIANEEELIITLFGNRNFSATIVAIQQLIDKGAKIKVIALGRVNNTIPQDRSYIIQTGSLMTKDLAKYLMVSDILILPENIYSGCSLKSGVLAAAIQFKIPTITMRGFLTEQILDKCLVYANSDNSEEYQELILKLQSNHEFRNKLKKECAMIANKLTWEKTYDNYIQIINEYIANH